MYFTAVKKSIKCSGCVIYSYLKTICLNYVSVKVYRRGTFTVKNGMQKGKGLGKV